jgi:hypothetical protein
VVLPPKPAQQRSRRRRLQHGPVHVPARTALPTACCCSCCCRPADISSRPRCCCCCWRGSQRGPLPAVLRGAATHAAPETLARPAGRTRPPALQRSGSIPRSKVCIGVVAADTQGSCRALPARC